MTHRLHRGPKDTFDGSSHGVSPCEGNSKDGRIGVQVESEVVLKCEGSNNEGVSVSCSPGCEDDCLVRHEDSC